MGFYGDEPSTWDPSSLGSILVGEGGCGTWRAQGQGDKEPTWYMWLQTSHTCPKASCDLKAGRRQTPCSPFVLPSGLLLQISGTWGEGISPKAERTSLVAAEQAAHSTGHPLVLVSRGTMCKGQRGRGNFFPLLVAPLSHNQARAGFGQLCCVFLFREEGAT